MRPLIVVNIEQLERLPMFVANLYGEDGYILDQLVVKHENIEHSFLRAGQMVEQAGFTSVDLWTSSPELFGMALKTSGFGAYIKHPDDTKDTRQVVEQHRDLLLDIYSEDINNERRLPPAGRFRKWAVFLLQRILKTLGVDKYDFGV